MWIIDIHLLTIVSIGAIILIELITIRLFILRITYNFRTN